MATRNPHWYNQNEQRSYPLDDAATAVDDNGVHLPSNILIDCNLRFPSTLGTAAFVGSVAVTERLVAVTILAENGGGFAPLAVVSVARPVDEAVQVAVLPQAPGVGGWVVFGSGANAVPYSGRFRTSVQSRLTARAARAYRPLPVENLRTLNAAEGLAGVVNLSAESPLQIVRARRTIHGVERDVALLQLTQVDQSGGFTSFSPDPLDSVLRQFAGPCAGRPESHTCADPEPVEFINGVGPDCNGVLTVEFRGCATIARIAGTCGVAIDCDLGLSGTCAPPRIPDDEGRLPNEYDPEIVLPPIYPPDMPVTTLDVSVDIVGELPYTECFGDDTADDFVVTSGSWAFSDDSSSSGDYCGVLESLPPAGCWMTTDPSIRSVAIWDGFDLATINRVTIVDLKMVPGPSGARHVAGVALNYRPHPAVAGRFVYHMAMLDYDTQSFRLSRFNGVLEQPIVDVTLPGLRLDSWYRIRTTVVPGPTAGSTSITAQLDGLDDPVTVTLGPLIVSNYYPSIGRNGLTADRTEARFGLFRIEEAP